MSFALIAAGIGLTLYAGFALSGAPASGAHRASALHPLFLASVFCLIYLFDLLYQNLLGVTALRGVTVNLSNFEISQVVLVHLWAFLGLVLGAVAAFRSRRRIKAVRFPDTFASAALVWFLLVSGGTLALYVSSFGPTFGLDEIGANKALNASRNPVLAQMFWLVVMSAAICITVEKVSMVRIALVLGIAVFTVFSSGVRGQLVVLAMAALYAFSLHGLRIGRWAALLALVPLALVLSVLRVLSRGGPSFAGDVQAYIGARGGLLSFLFETDEISHAEIFSQFVLNEHLPLWRFPFQGLLGVLAVPLPRDWFAWKPTALSTDFTRYWSPEIYANSRSELVVGGFSEAVLEFGVIFAPVLTALVGYVTVRLFLRSIHASKPSALFACLASIGVLFFLRNELFILGIVAWPALISALGALMLAWAIKALGRPALRV